MNFKDATISLLENYSAKKLSIDSLATRITMLSSRVRSPRTSRPDKAPISGCSGNNDYFLDNIAERQELERERRYAKEDIQWLESGLSALREDEQLIIDRLYISPLKGNIERLRGELGLANARSVHRAEDKTLRRLTILLYGTVKT